MEIIRIEVGPLMTNCYILIEDNGEAIVVDPGYPSEELISLLESQGIQVVSIVDTHAHVDHVAGNRAIHEICQAGIAIHAKEVPFLENIEVQAAFFQYPCDPSPDPERLLKEGDDVLFGQTALRVLETPGHSPGSISLAGPDFVIVGDSLFAGSIGRTDLPGGSHETLLGSIREKLFVLDDDTRVLPGHGPETQIGREKRFNPFF